MARWKDLISIGIVMGDCMKTQNTAAVSSIKMRNKKADNFSDISNLVKT